MKRRRSRSRRWRHLQEVPVVSSRPPVLLPGSPLNSRDQLVREGLPPFVMPDVRMDVGGYPQVPGNRTVDGYFVVARRDRRGGFGNLGIQAFPIGDRPLTAI